MANVAAYHPGDPPAAAPDLPGGELRPGDHGIDVASYQHPREAPIDWHEVARSGCRFGWVKSTESTNYRNPWFESDWPRVRAAGLVRGAYHFAQPDRNSAQAELSFFLNTVGVDLEDDDMLALDIEAGSGDLFGWVLEFLRDGANWAGRKLWLYSGPWFMGPHNLEQRELADAAAGLWYAAYQASVPAPPRGWEHVGVGIWQYTSEASVPGVASACDANLYRPG